MNECIAAHQAVLYRNSRIVLLLECHLEAHFLQQTQINFKKLNDGIVEEIKQSYNIKSFKVLDIRHTNNSLKKILSIYSISIVLGKSKRIFGGNGWIPCYDQLTFYTVYFSLITRIDLISQEKKCVSSIKICWVFTEPAVMKQRCGYSFFGA